MVEKHPDIFTIDEGNSIYTNENKFFPRTYMFTKVEDAAFIKDHMGFLMEKEDVVELIGRLQEFVDNVTDQEIKEHNEKLLDDYNKPPENNDKKVATKKVVGGHIYLIKADNGLVKIGKTTDLKTRLDHFTAKLPYEVKLIHSIETNDHTKLERKLHDLFEHKRKRGEWFELNEKEIQYVKKKYKNEHNFPA